MIGYRFVIHLMDNSLIVDSRHLKTNRAKISETLPTNLKSNIWAIFMRHRQTVQTQVIHHRTRCLIYVFNVYLHDIVL